MTEETLFTLAVEKAAGAERQAFVDRVCADDSTLRHRLARLLAADDRNEGILDRGPDPAAVLAMRQQETPAFDQSPDTTPYTEGSRAARQTDPPGYELIEKVGEGGMGIVYVTVYWFFNTGCGQTICRRRTKHRRSGPGRTLAVGHTEVERSFARTTGL
jgi:hypothetical protein